MDLKPDNIMLVSDDNNNILSSQIQLIDFGFAQRY